MNLFQEIQISKMECFKKYKMYKEKCESQPERIKILANMFNIDENNKPAMFFLLYGLNAIDQEVKYLNELIIKKGETNEELCGN